MSLSALGRRYERLLFFAAPLSFASVLTLFVVFATENQKERETARCYGKAADLLDQKRSNVEEWWKAIEGRTGHSNKSIDYIYGIRQLLIDTSLGRDCYTPLIEEVEKRAKDGPASLVSGLREDAKRLNATPIRYSGVEIPEKAKIDVMGASISIELTLFASLLQVVLAPLMLLWLGSLYNTRYRETLLIEKAKDVSQVFPHLVNVYPAVRYPEPKRRSHIQPHIKHVFAFIYALMRIGLLLLFLGPAVAAYIAGILLLTESTYFPLLGLLALLVALFSFTLVLCELLPWHYNKSFPGPPLVTREP